MDRIRRRQARGLGRICLVLPVALVGGTLADACVRTNWALPGYGPDSQVTVCGDCRETPIFGPSYSQAAPLHLAHDEACLGQPALDGKVDGAQITETGIELAQDGWRTGIESIRVLRDASECKVTRSVAWSRETECRVTHTPVKIDASDCREVLRCVGDSIRELEHDDDRLCADCSLDAIEWSENGTVHRGLSLGPHGCLTGWIARLGVRGMSSSRLPP
jgi:hypothetical protein